MSRWLAGLLVVCLLPGIVRSQDAGTLLQRVPDDLGFRVVINDLRGQAERWKRTSWLPKLEANPIVRGILEGKEVADLRKLEGELKRLLDVDFAFLRDEILGDAIVYGYRPVSQAGGERGLLLVKARKAETLKDVVARFNEFQSNIGELTSLEDRKHGNQTYHRRVHQQATHFYAIEGPVLAISNTEATLKDYLDRKAAIGKSRRDQWTNAGGEKAVASLLIDPRLLDDEFEKQAKTKTGPEAVILQAVVKFWQDLDGVALTLQGDESPEVRLTLLARPDTSAAKLWSAPAPPPLAIWTSFSSDALLSAAVPVDFVRVLGKIRETLPPNDAGAFDFLVQKNLGAVAGLDVNREVLPNIGPDLGLTVTLSQDAGWPRALVALAVKSAPKEMPVDQSLLRTANFFLGLAVFDFNRKNAEPIRIRTVRQGDVEVKYLTHDKALPAGVEPALALKDGYLLAASSPEAIADFRVGRSPSPTGDETPLVKISPKQLSRLLKAHRQAAIDHLVRKNNDPADVAANIVDGVIAGLDVFESLTLTQRAGEGRSSWILRATPAR